MPTYFIFSSINIPVLPLYVKDYLKFFGKNNSMEIIIVYAVGALAYGLIEILFRGYTHWSMLLCGGLCFTLMYLISSSSLPLFAKCAVCALAISAVEFCAGCLVNITLGWHIWDYSDRALNIMGQVCPLFTMLWFFLSIPGLKLCDALRQIF